MKKIIISETQLKELTTKLKVNESHGEGSYMAKQQLYVIAIMAMKMWESMEEGEQLDDWMESKIAQAEQSIIAVVKNYMYDEFVENPENQGGMNKLNFDDLIIGK